MSLATVIVSFLVCLSLNVFLNSFDVISDIILSYQTLTFNLGDSILLSGCKVCTGKEDNDVFSVKNRTCQRCLIRNSKFDCGNSFAILDKLDELEKSSTCATQKFGVDFDKTSKSFKWKNGKCDSDNCCVQIKQKLSTLATIHHFSQFVLYHNLLNKICVQKYTF